MATSTQSLSRVNDLTRDVAGEVRQPRRAGSDFERLYAQFMPRVRGLVRKLVHDSDLVDDLVQETFLRAYHGGLHGEYRKAHSQHDQWPWLAAVARNLSLDVLRRRKIVVEHEIDDHDVLSEAAGDDPEVCLLATRRRESINEALASVSERHRRILVMKVIEGRRYEDIAADEGISIEALKSVLARARRTFRASYDTIAQRRGLGVLVGGGLLRGVGARLRSLRDRLAPGASESMVNLAASAPAAMNAVVTAVLLGSVAVAGALAGSGDEGTPAGLSRPVARVSEPAEAPPPKPVRPVAPPAEVAEAPAPEAVPDPVVVVESPPPPPAPVATGGDDYPTRVDTDDYVPVEDPPGGGEAEVYHHEQGDERHLDHKLGLDTDGDGETDTGDTGSTQVDCDMDDDSVTLATTCYALETADEATAGL